MKRREFITLIGGAVASFLSPFAARAQQRERVRRIGLLLAAGIADDPDERAHVPAFVQMLQQLGWIDGSNVRIDYRRAAGDPAVIRQHAEELAALAPDAILASGTSTLRPLLGATRTVPIVFVNVTDPVGAGFIKTLARPGGNATGFLNYEYSLSAKWLELLKEMMPGMARAAVLRDAETSGIGQFAVIQSVASTLGIEVSPVDIYEATEIERAVAEFARGGHGGLVITGSALTVRHRELIIALAARYKLPAVYHRRYFVTTGGLVSYGGDAVDHFRRAAGYVDRILKGEKPAEMPVQVPTKYELVINLKTAKAVGITVPPTLLARADEVIE